MWSSWLGQNREPDEEHDEYCVAEMVREAGIGIVDSSKNIWDRSGLELLWSRRIVSYIEKNFPIFLLSSNSNILLFKVCIEGLLQYFP